MSELKTFMIRMATYAIVEAESKEDALNVDCSKDIIDNLETIEVIEW